MSNVIRIFVEKKSGFDVEAQHIKADLKGNLGMGAIEDLRLLHRYDVSGLSQEEFQAASTTIFSEPNVDDVYGEDFVFPEGYQVFAMEYLPGQYDQRADSAAQCVSAFDPRGTASSSHRSCGRNQRSVEPEGNRPDRGLLD